MAAVARTRLDQVPLGSNDPLWSAPGSVHALPGRVAVEADPLGGGKVTRHEIRPGDYLWRQTGTNRCETTTPLIGLREGERGQVAFSVLLPVGFRSSTSKWNSLCDLHYPNDGPAQSPLTLSVVSSTELWLRVLGGPLTADGTMGTVRVEQRIADLAHGVWHSIVIDVEQSVTAGVCDIYVDGARVFGGSKIPTISGGKPNSVYWKQGFYRSAADGQLVGTQRMFFRDTAFFRGADASEALAFVGAPGPVPAPAPPVPPVPPAPAPDPAAAQKAIDAIRAANPKIAAAVQATLDYARAIDAARTRP